LTLVGKPDTGDALSQKKGETFSRWYSAGSIGSGSK
jgi:hypothetical protein